ncbi:32159_t:CDS:2, partial [Gigaspora margarita]
YLKFEFWTQSKNPANDLAMLKQLYKDRYLSTTPEHHENIADQLWNAFQDALDINICVIDGKRRILLIIADKIPYDIIINKKLLVSNYLITKASQYAHINSPGGIQLEKLKITLEKLAPEKKEEIDTNKSDRYSIEEMWEKLIELVKV